LIGCLCPIVITDAMWDRIEPLMPADPVRGRRWADHRRTLEAIAWKYRTNSPWRDLPDELGSFQSAHKRLIRWAVDGTWEMIFAAVLAAADADATSTGRCRWTPPSSGLTSTLPEHSKGGGPLRRARRSRARTLPRRADQQSPSTLRRPSPPAALADLARSAGWQPGVRPGAGRLTYPAPRHGPPG
jgi:transposase